MSSTLIKTFLCAESLVWGLLLLLMLCKNIPFVKILYLRDAMTQ